MRTTNDIVMMEARGNALVIDERQLTKRVGKSDVERTLDEFSALSRDYDDYEDGDYNDDAKLIISTTDSREARARVLLDLGEAALARLFGRDSKFDVSVITAQSETSARVRVMPTGLLRFAKRVGLEAPSESEQVERIQNVLSNRISTEYQLLMLTFENTDLLADPQLTIQFDKRVLSVARARRFR